MQKPIWLESTSEQKVVLITLLMMANHQGKEWEWKGEKYKAEPGQFVTSLESITQKCGKGISVQNVRTALKRFEKYDFLTSESTNKNRLITIVNWGLYQETKDTANKQTDKQLTSNQQAPNKQLTTNNNDNNDNNEKKVIKKIKYADYVSMLENEYLKLIDQFGESGTKDRIEKLSLYKGSTGKKYKNDYLTILSWERNNKKGGGKSGSTEDSRRFAEEYGIQF
ncbi:MAG: DnaD domain-containing protein [Bacillota bacterium]